MTKSRIIVGITGSSGIVYGIKILEELRKLNIETHLVVSKAGHLTRTYETKLTAKELLAKADFHYPYQDITANIASGSFKTMGMIIAPCSMKTLGEIANSIPSNLLTRAADVVLKERRKLILLTRETPLHYQHIQNMLQATQMGAIIFPPNPAFYQNPQTIEDIVNDSVGRVLDLFDLDTGQVKRWDNHKK